MEIGELRFEPGLTYAHIDGWFFVVCSEIAAVKGSIAAHHSHAPI